MNLKDIKEWKEKGGEVFIENSEEIEWLIKTLERVTDIAFDLCDELNGLKGLPNSHWGT